MKFSIKDILRKCDQIHRKLRIWSYLPKKLFMENFIFHIQWPEYFIDQNFPTVPIVYHTLSYVVLHIFAGRY